ncbi:hypothetical protein BG004_004299, partial [Podila humilis]
MAGSGSDGSGGSQDHFKAFKGVVLQDSDMSSRKWNQAAPKRSIEHQLFEDGVVGWARMTIEHDENEYVDSIILRGAFTVDSDTYHVTTRQHYHVQKRSDDHTPSQPSSNSNSRSGKSNLVIYRDSDLLQPDTRLKKRAVPLPQSCGTTPSPFEPVGPHGYYYPPDLTTTLSDSKKFPGSRIFGILKTGLHKRDIIDGDNNSSISAETIVKVAGPNPVPTGCPTTRMIAYIGVAADCTYVRSYGGLSNARKQIFADFNTASAIYESTFNVALGVKSLVIESMNCPSIPVQGEAWNQECSTNYTINNRLSDFSFWRGQGGRSKDGISLWHLLTKCSSGSILGIAWTKALCQSAAIAQGTDYTSGTAVSSITPHEWLVVAHEIAHGFGAQHDCTETTCETNTCCPFSDTVCNAADKFIMNPSEQATTKLFSPCSIDSICSTISGRNGKCLQPASSTASTKSQDASSNVCGNGLREEGEQCDCGSPEECADDPCCDGTTCRFKGTAVCDDLHDDCCINCQLAPRGLICRSAISSCDIAETCTGTAVNCPPDIMVPDLTVCQGPGNFTGQCAKGTCTSRDLQCAQQQRPGITKQCAAAKAGCEFLCNDPSGDENTCMKIPSLSFMDGTVCGNSDTGTCSNGKCVLPGGWARNHLSIIIPVVCVVVLAIVGGSLGCICLRRKRKLAKVGRPPGSLSTFPSRSSSSAPGTSSSKRQTESTEASSDPSSSESKYKDKEADIPRWMLANYRDHPQANHRDRPQANRHDRPQAISSSRRSSETILSRRISAQINLRDANGSNNNSADHSNNQPTGMTWTDLTPQELRQQYFDQFQQRIQQPHSQQQQQGYGQNDIREGKDDEEQG